MNSKRNRAEGRGEGGGGGGGELADLGHVRFAQWQNGALLSAALMLFYTLLRFPTISYISFYSLECISRTIITIFTFKQFILLIIVL